ncbi:IS630 family transposase [Streptomyces wedmorensis]
MLDGTDGGEFSFLDESGVSLLPQVRRTYAPRGRTPLLRHRLNWKRASMAGALGYHAADPERGPRLCFHLKPGSYDTVGLIEVLEQMKAFYRGERVVLVWDGLSAHWSRAMRAWVAEQDWLTLERLPAYAPELNPVEPLWSSVKKRELANLAGNHLADVTDAADNSAAASTAVHQPVSRYGASPSSASACRHCPRLVVATWGSGRR